MPISQEVLDQMKQRIRTKLVLPEEINITICEGADNAIDYLQITARDKQELQTLKAQIESILFETLIFDNILLFNTGLRIRLYRQHLSALLNEQIRSGKRADRPSILHHFMHFQETPILDGDGEKIYVQFLSDLDQGYPAVMSRTNLHNPSHIN